MSIENIRLGVAQIIDFNHLAEYMESNGYMDGLGYCRKTIEENYENIGDYEYIVENFGVYEDTTKKDYVALNEYNQKVREMFGLRKDEQVVLKIDHGNL